MRRLRLAQVSPNVPLAVIDTLTRSILPLRSKGELLWWQLDNNVEQLLHQLSRAERIKKTPVPLSYSRHTSRFFSVYTFTLPFALCSSFTNLVCQHGPEPRSTATSADCRPVFASRMEQWLLPPSVAVISWVLFATEEIGHIIEEPFGRGLTEDPDQLLKDGATSPDAISGVQLEVLPLGRYPPAHLHHCSHSDVTHLPT